MAPSFPACQRRSRINSAFCRLQKSLRDRDRKMDRHSTSGHSSFGIGGRCLASAVVLLAMTCCAYGQQGSQNFGHGLRPSTGRPSNPAAATQDCATGAAANDTPHSIKLSWNPSTSPANMVEGYFIFRRESGPECQKSGNTCVKLNAGTPIVGNSCTDYAVQPGHTYIYQARTAGPNSTVSGFSNEARATAR